MLKSYATQAITSKARAMYGHRLTMRDYNEMMKKRSVPEVAAYLRDNTHYRDVLGQLDLANIHRARLEQAVRSHRQEQYHALMNYVANSGSKFYQFLYLWEEIDEIIEVLRHITSESDDYFFHYSAYLPRYASYDIKALVGVSTYEEMFTVLERTPYKKILEKTLSNEDGVSKRTKLITCEHNLKIYYYDTIFAMIKKDFSKTTTKELQNFFYHQIDTENIVAAFRLRKFFKNDKSQIEKALLPYKTPSHKLIADIASCADDKLLAGILAGSKLFDGELLDNDYVESLTLRSKEKISKRLLRFSINAPSVLASYMALTEIELENVINIIEAIRYGLSTEDTKKLLITA